MEGSVYIYFFSFSFVNLPYIRVATPHDVHDVVAVVVDAHPFAPA